MPINILVFFIVNLKSSILKMFIQKLCHRDTRGHRIVQIAAFAATVTVPATSTSFLKCREVDLPLYACTYLAPLTKHM